MSIKTKVLNNKGVHIADAYVPSKGEKELFENMHELKEQLKETKQLNQSIKEKLSKL